MYHPNRILERELEFTKIYRENIGQPKAVRESRCMDAQMATYFVTMQPHDLIAGRISRPYVVFAQCMEGDGIDKTGYCIDVANCEKELKRMKADDSYSEEDCMQAEEMIQFWKTENTNTKIRQQFPKSWAGSMGGDDYVHDNAAIHPLYRLAGVNLDFKKLFRLGICGLRDEALRLAQETQDSEKKNFYEGEPIGNFDILQKSRRRLFFFRFCLFFRLFGFFLFFAVGKSFGYKQVFYSYRNFSVIRKSDLCFR